MNVKGNRRRFFLLLIVMFSVSIASCSSGTRLPRLAADAVVLAFGDSLTFGTGAEQTESYPAVLEKMINRRVVNAGIPGEVTGEGLSRLPEILDKEKPALMLLCHGGNDLLRRLNLQHTAHNLRAMILLAQQRGVPVVLIAVPSPGLSLSPQPLYREAAAELKIPLEEKILADVLADGSFKSDYIHPNAAGYRRMAETLATLLRKSGAIE